MPAQPGPAQRERGDHAGAKTSHEEALAIFRKVLPEALEIASCLTHLWPVQQALNDHAAAEEPRRGPGHRPQGSPANSKIALCLFGLGGLQRGSVRTLPRRSHEEALAIYRKARPELHDTADCLIGLGSRSGTWGGSCGGEASHEEALAIYRKTLRDGHPDIATSLNGLGHVQRYLREYAAAKRSHEEALAIDRKALPDGHPDIATSLYNLGRLSLDSGVEIGNALLTLAEATDLCQAEQLQLAVVQAEPEQLVTAGTSHCP